MSQTLATPTNAAEQAEVDYGEQLIWRLVGATITSFGANEAGEIFLAARDKSGQRIECLVGKDETGDIALFEVKPR